MVYNGISHKKNHPYNVIHHQQCFQARSSSIMYANKAIPTETLKSLVYLLVQSLTTKTL